VRGQEGSIFWARLPFGIEVGGGEHDLASILRRMRILVMGDPAPGTRVLVEKVESWGASPSTVPSPEDTLEAIRRGVDAGEPYEAVVVHVSGADAGVERLAMEVRGDRSVRETPLIAVAVRGLRGDARRFTQAGYDAYLAGPVRDGVLLATLRLLRERGRGWDALARGGER